MEERRTRFACLGADLTSGRGSAIAVMTFVLIHGAGDVGWYWHLNEAALRDRGHDTIAPDLPCDHETASRLPARLLVLLAGMIPVPGESPGDWWTNTGYRQAAEEQARLDGGKTGNEDPLISYYNGAPRSLAEEALRRGGRGESSAVWNIAMAAGCMAGRADQVHPLPGRPLLPARLHASSGPRAPGRGPR